MTMRLGKITAGIAGGFMILMLGIGIGELGNAPQEGELAKRGAMTIAPYAGESTPLPQATKSVSPKVAPKTLPKATKKAPKATTEDSPGWDCRTQGNHICGPNAPGGHAAGCYRAGVRVIAWSNYSTPRKDPLWGQVHSPCAKAKVAPSKKAHKVPGATIAGVCRHPSITKDMLADCNKLASRPAESTSSYSNPQGKVLVKECTDQYKGEELAICLK
jgi:hypothetical protein